MNLVITEPEYGASVWGTELLRGLVKELRFRRRPYTVYTESDYRKSNKPPEKDDSVFIIGADPGFLERTVSYFNDFSLIPVVLATAFQRPVRLHCHLVSSDMLHSVSALLKKLRESYGDRIALYGVNRESGGDMRRRELFLSEIGDESKVYENPGSIARCYESFAGDLSRYDAVVTVNGFLAVSLLRHLKAEKATDTPLPAVYNLADTMVSADYPEIHSVKQNLSLFGKAAVRLSDVSKALPEIGELTAKVRWEETKEPLPKDEFPDDTEQSASENAFYGDAELQSLLLLEHLYNRADETDLKIIAGVKKGESAARISRYTFLTESAVKYRIRKMCADINVKDRKAFSSFLNNSFIE